MTAGRVRIVARKSRPSPPSAGFTLTELLTVLGLVSLLVSLLLPVVGKARAAANATVCLSNLRQMGAAWLTYSVENRGQMPSYAWNSGDARVAWDGYWPGILSTYHVGSPVLLCPSAREPLDDPVRGGYGNVAHAWTGKFVYIGSPVRLNDATYRESSYGYNRFMTAGGGFAGDTAADKATSARSASTTPVFLDCADPDVRPLNGSEQSPVEPPPNLRGDRISVATPDHWTFLLARHGRGVNVCMADGSARWTPLEETYLLTWRNDWVPYRLKLPLR